MEETVLFQSGNVLVTNTRFVSGNQTFSIANTTSVQSGITSPKRFWAIVIMVIGAFALLGAIMRQDYNGAGMVWGALLVGGGIIWIKATPPLHYVAIGTAGKEISALESSDKALVDSIVKALNDAIIARG